MKRAVHQFHTHVFRRDAIGENVLALQDGLRALGYASDIFCASREEALGGRAISFEQYHRHSSPDNVLIVHYCFKTPLLPRLLALPDRKILLYHNITPAEMFAGFSSRAAREAREAREELKTAVGKVDLAVGVSNYNWHELKSMGFSRGAAIPFLHSVKDEKREPDAKTLRKYKKDGWVNWLFVGRISPNKRQEDIIKSFYYYCKFINPRSRLIFVGNYEGMEFYYQYLKSFAAFIGISNNVVFAGSIGAEELASLYRLADLFVVMSEHEGFCVPLLEAMNAGVPILAFDSTAVGETLGGCGVLVKEKRFPEIGELAHYILEHPDLRQRLVERQRRRFKDFAPELILGKWAETLQAFFPHHAGG